MSKSVFIVILIAAAVGYYLYRTNRFEEINASFEYTSTTVTVAAKNYDLHDCKLNLTNDFSVDIPFVRRNSRVTIGRDDLKQWNGTALESTSLLGPKIEFKLRCKEGAMTTTETNRYLKSEEPARESRDEEEVDSR